VRKLRIAIFTLFAFVLLSASAPAADPRKVDTGKSEAEPSPTASYRAFQKKLLPEQRILHAVSRLTYGPRPGDIEQIQALGVKKWIDQQLHPERIRENPELARKLEPLESLRMTSAQAERSFPNPQLIRAIMAGREKMPEDPVTRAAVERVMRRVRASKGGPGQNGDDARLEPLAPLETLLTREQIRTLRTGTLEQRREILASIPEDKKDDLAIALPPGMRFQVLPAASPELRRKLLLLTAPQQLIAFDLAEGKLYRAILSHRQLEEQLVDFWYNHFNVFLDKGADRYMVPSYERDAIRPHVLGRFRDLLEATAKSPAMLFYLDNWQSVGADVQRRGPLARQARRGLNENYARELMELHTLGVDGGYTQKDVTEVARCFTGWTIRPPREGGGFFYNDRVHDKGEKIVLGVRIPAGGGQDDAEKVLEILAKHPSTARFISRKLAQRFVADDPPPKLIERMAKTFRKTNGDIWAVVKVMVTSDEFFSEGAYRAKVKTPLEMVVSAVRALGADVDFAFPLANQLNQFGQPLYRKLEPTGYSNLSSEWVNSASLLARMNFAMSLTQNRVPGVSVNAARFGDEPASAARLLLPSGASVQTLAAIETALADQQADQVEKRPAIVTGLILGSPEFQKR
jgi:uncharacterized protein (DUF1800 family)